MYDFAPNKLKLQRAIAAAGTDADEEKVKEIYISFGGLVIEESAAKEVEEKPKKTSKK